MKVRLLILLALVVALAAVGAGSSVSTLGAAPAFGKAPNPVVCGYCEGGGSMPQYVGCINNLCCDPAHQYWYVYVDLSNNTIHYAYECGYWIGRWQWKQVQVWYT